MCFADQHNTPAGSDAHWLAAHMNGYYSRARRELWQQIVSVAAFNCPEPPRTICDFGCGDGSVLVLLGERWPKAELYGVDYSPVALDMARRKTPVYTKLMRSDLCDLDIRDDVFDVGLCVQTLEHVKDYETALSEMMRTVVKLMVLSVPNGDVDKFGGHHHRWSLVAFDTLLQRFGSVHTTYSTSSHHIIAAVQRD